MDKNGLIVILCKTNSTSVYDLVYDYLKDFYGENSVKKITAALYGKVDEIADNIIHKGLENKVEYYLLRDEGFRPYDDPYYVPMAKTLMKKGCTFAYIFDPTVEELMYSGTMLKEKIVEKIYVMKKLIENCF